MLFDWNENGLETHDDIQAERRCARGARKRARLNKVRDGASIGDAPEFVRATNKRDAFQKAGKRVREWCMSNAGGLKLHQVAVLAPGNTERDWPADFQTVPLTKDFDAWRKGKGVLIASWARFKGLEADAIVIVEMLALDNDQERANRYVARSRAKHLLFADVIKWMASPLPHR